MQHQHSFFASLESLNEKDHTATFYLMNTSPNRNRWGVTAQALEEALPTLQGKKIGMGKNYQTQKHYSETIDSGTFTNYEFNESYASATAKIDDAKTWDMMKNGELGPISVVISCFLDVCSKCSANLRGIDSPEKTHSCFAASETFSRVESFVFTRVDFVDVPAYPQAGVMEMSAAFYSSKHVTLDDAIREMRGVMQFPDDSDESKYTFKKLFELQDQQFQAQAKKAEYTTKEAAALEDAIAKMRIKCAFAPGYES